MSTKNGHKMTEYFCSTIFLRPEPVFSISYIKLPILLEMFINLGNAENQAQGCWVRSANANPLDFLLGKISRFATKPFFVALISYQVIDPIR